MRPRVVLHNSISADGRVDGFSPDLAVHYGRLSNWNFDVHLVGSNTVLKQADENPEPEAADGESPPAGAGDARSLLVIPDSRGRVRNWRALLQAGYWRDGLALCSRSTPPAYLSDLKKQNIGWITAGEDHVDLKGALEELGRRGSRSVLLDGGPTLNGFMFRAGLVDELSLLVHPCLVGGAAAGSFFRDPGSGLEAGLIGLKLSHLEMMENGIIWYRYEVIR